MLLAANIILKSLVAPLAGAWIEIAQSRFGYTPTYVASLAGAWIEIPLSSSPRRKSDVAPLAGAWIEMRSRVRQVRLPSRRTPRGCVD